MQIRRFAGTRELMALATGALECTNGFSQPLGRFESPRCPHAIQQINGFPVLVQGDVCTWTGIVLCGGLSALAAWHCVYLLRDPISLKWKSILFRKDIR